MKKSFDFVIVGGGIIGLTVARTLLERGRYSVAILEKEEKLGVHASGRNSGVLHAGFYYSADSLKAKVCAEGARLMYEYALEHKIDVQKTGKVVVGTGPEAIPQMDVLLDRARSNGIQLEKIDLKRLRELEPEATQALPFALYSPNTAVIDSRGVLETLEKELVQKGVTIFKDEEVVDIHSINKTVRTQKNLFDYGHLINCSGLHADRLAHMMGVGMQYQILPFKGIYRKLTPAAAQRFRGSIYPVPDLNVPFLGVHVTRNIKDEVYLGPTAIPAFGRENYGAFSGISIQDGTRIATSLSRMILKNVQGMRRSVTQEIDRYSLNGFLKAAQAIAPSLRAEDLLNTGKVGLRAQLYHTKTCKLEMDFVIENGPSSTHILNAISPAFTASFSFSKLIVNKMNI